MWSFDTYEKVITHLHIDTQTSMKTFKMRKQFFCIVVMFLVFGTIQAADWGNAQWIWQKVDGTSKTWMCFQKTVSLDKIPRYRTNPFVWYVVIKPKKTF